MLHSDITKSCLNDLTLINYANIGTPKQGKIISRIIENWDNRRYLKPSEKFFHIGSNKIRLKQYPNMETRM